MNSDTQDKLKRIKQSFRLIMNGVASQSMRDKGLDYKINWGVPLPLLKKMAEEYGKDYNLAIELWKENIRECKILSIMIMPAEKMLPEITDVWMENLQSQELAEIISMYLFQYLDYAPIIAYEWIASDKELYQICGYHVLARLFMKGQEPNERGINEMLDQARTAIEGNSLAVKRAASVCVQRFAQLGEQYKQITKSALKSLNLELF